MRLAHQHGRLAEALADLRYGDRSSRSVRLRPISANLSLENDGVDVVRRPCFLNHRARGHGHEVNWANADEIIEVCPSKGKRLAQFLGYVRQRNLFDLDLSALAHL